LFVHLLLFISSALCLIYGIKKYAGKKVALFSVLVVGAIGCFMLGHLYEFISMLIINEIPKPFNIGILARIGGFSFIFSASFAQMDGLVDDKTKAIRKYRFIAISIPVIIAGIYVPILISNVDLSIKITSAVIFAFAMLPGYYNFKHLIIPDVSMGIIDSVRYYSLFSICSTICYCLMLCFDVLEFNIAYIIFAILLAICYPCVVISMEKGRKKWII